MTVFEIIVVDYIGWFVINHCVIGESHTTPLLQTVVDTQLQLVIVIPHHTGSNHIRQFHAIFCHIGSGVGNGSSRVVAHHLTLRICLQRMTG